MDLDDPDLDRSFSGLRAVIDWLRRDQGLCVVLLRWGITETALLWGAAPPVRRIEGAGTDSLFEEFRLATGEPYWRIALCSEDQSDGIPYFSDHFGLSTPAVSARAEAIEAWLRAHPHAYDLFEPVKWSAAPARAAAAKAWMEANRPLWESSPLRPVYEDLYALLVNALR